MTIKTPEWVKDAIFYQIFPDRFAKSIQFGTDGYLPKPQNLQPWGAKPTYHGFQGGDLLGAAEKLDYLADLGINAIYLNPIFASASNHRYHTHDYFQVDPLLGGNKAFKTFLDAAHKKNMRVILDGVFNHASRGFFQFNHLLECGPESPYVHWFHVHGWPINAYNEDQQPNYAAWWGIHSLPKFNTNTPDVREFLWRVGTYWLEQGIDGWRLDVPNEIDDDSFWQEFRRRCKAVNPDAYIVGEIWGDGQRWLQGDQFDAIMNYVFTRAAFGFLVGERMDQRDTVRCGYGYIQPINGSQCAAEFERMFNHCYHPEIVLSQLNMLGSHDTPRIRNVAAHDFESVRLLYLCQMTVPGVPNIYYGDEIGMAGGHDPDCRRAFPWEDEGAWRVDLRRYVQALIRLRHRSTALRRGDFAVLHADEKVLVYQRRYRGETAVIALNSGDTPALFTCPDFFQHTLQEQLTQNGETLQANRQMALPKRSGRVWININSHDKI